PAMYIVLIVLLMMSAFFSASETAFSTVNKIRLKNYAENGSQKAKVALDVAENFDKTLSAILIGNNVVNIAASAIATMLATAVLGTKGVLLSTVVMTILVLIFGEILPKSVAKENSEKLSLKMAGIMKMLTVLLSPLIFLFIKLKQIVVKFSDNDEKNPSVTEQELMYILETIEEEGVLNEQESELVQSALQFDDIMVKEIITHRVDIAAIDINDSPDDTLNTIISEGFSRMPVYEKNIDNIIGILHTRDYLEAKLKGEPLNIRKMLSEPYYVHKTQKIGELLNEFRKNKLHIAIVTDDYGGTMGIATMEDMLEELVGEIWDEDEIEETEITQTGINSYEVNGDTSISDLFEELEMDDKELDTDYSSVSGWALEVLGHVPSENESFEYEDIIVTVTKMDDNRVIKLKVVRKES
ncbi:MAG: hemolysin family protein, partial [Oscillospiraceae bacterium]